MALAVAGQARYLWMAGVLREPILNGLLPPGARLPSRAQLSRNYSVSEQVSRHALRLLVTEGLVESRPGSGYYVRMLPAGCLLPRTADCTVSAADPLRWERLGTRSEAAGRATARRLGLRTGEPLYRTELLGRARGLPVALHTSWEPAALTLNTPWNPRAAHALSVPERLAAAGVLVDRVEEEVTVRGLREPEADRLGMSPGLTAFAVQRTHRTGRRPVEVSDLIASTDHCRLGYRLPVAQHSNGHPENG